MKSNFDIKDDVAIIRINRNIYPKEVIIQATYVMLEDFYFLVDEDENYFIVNMKFKEDKEENNLQLAIFRFFDELIESQAYIDQLTRTAKLREIILERALLGQTLDDETLESMNLSEESEK